jgi:ankyrin repeat protein
MGIPAKHLERKTTTRTEVRCRGDDETCIHKACLDTDVSKFLLLANEYMAQGIDINEVTCAEYGHATLLEMVLEDWGDEDDEDNVLRLCAFLLLSGADPNAYKVQHPAFHAVYMSTPGVLSLLKRYGVDVVGVRDQGRHLLHKATTSAVTAWLLQHPEFVEMINDRDVYGSTPLDYAMGDGCENVEMLLAHGARTSRRPDFLNR